jgi:hypothetical protein
MLFRLSSLQKIVIGECLSLWTGGNALFIVGTKGALVNNHPRDRPAVVPIGVEAKAGAHADDGPEGRG